MLKLMKYELRKTWLTKVILLAVTAIAEIIYLIGLYGEREGALITGIFLLTLLAFGGIMVIGLESVITLHRDMNTRQGYMLFMTPNSCYKILGAKVLECGISILLAGAFFFALGSLDITLLFAKQGELGALWRQIQEILSNIVINGRPLQLDVQVIAAFVFSILASWIVLITTAYLADVISAALLNGKKFNGVISFILFLLLNWAVSYLTGLVTTPIRDSVASMSVGGLLDLAIAGGMYYVTAMIMDRYLSV